ncbi:uncharacterized protein LOC143208192 [Lasioglossum baleicum]|uniref:uncharacterized protein LOC143208192 n=1 Tax=Lasioglossum baleicum TaxID=434251 RepID=UPI003FCDF6AE
MRALEIVIVVVMVGGGTHHRGKEGGKCGGRRRGSLKIFGHRFPRMRSARKLQQQLQKDVYPLSGLHSTTTSATAFCIDVLISPKVCSRYAPGVSEGCPRMSEENARWFNLRKEKVKSKENPERNLEGSGRKEGKSLGEAGRERGREKEREPVSELVGGDNGSLEIGLSISTTPRPLAQVC